MNVQGINEKSITKISNYNKENEFLCNYRLDSYKKYIGLSKPIIGPDIKLDYDKLCFKLKEEIYDNINNIPNDIKAIYKKYSSNNNVILQYNSTTIYNNINDIICASFDVMINKYPDLFYLYFNKLIKNDENYYSAINNSIWSNSLFVYIPPHTKIDCINKYIGIDKNNIGVINKVIIVVDEYSYLNINEYLISSINSIESINISTIEIFVKKHSKCIYNSIQDFNKNMYNVTIKRAFIEDNGYMKWNEINIGAKYNIGYPTCILDGKNSKGIYKAINCSSKDQVQDIGYKMIHRFNDTVSNIDVKNIVLDNGELTYRTKIRIATSCINSTSSIKNTVYMNDCLSKYNSIPNDIIRNNLSSINHVDKIKKVNKSVINMIEKKINSIINK